MTYYILDLPVSEQILSICNQTAESIENNLTPDSKVIVSIKSNAKDVDSAMKEHTPYTNNEILNKLLEWFN